MKAKLADVAKTLLVRDLMQIGVPTCADTTALAEAAQRLLDEKLEALVVLDDHGNAVGLLGRREVVATYVRWGIAPSHTAPLTVADAMNQHIPEVPPDIPAAAAAQLMLDQHLREMYLLHHDGGHRWPSAVLRFAWEVGESREPLSSDPQDDAQ